MELIDTSKNQTINDLKQKLIAEATQLMKIFGAIIAKAQKAIEEVKN